MKNHRKGTIKTIIAFVLLAVSIGVATFITFIDEASVDDVAPDKNTMIQLYGETHGQKKFYAIELERWGDCYSSGMRNLFVELPYYTAGYLNYWMKAEDDAIIDQIFIDISGTQSANEYYKEFLHTIKKEYPETVFYGTDVGHQYSVTGARYLEFLTEMGMEDSYEYELTLRNIEQGMIFSEEHSQTGITEYRESCMVDNFIEAYDRTGGKIMGIYGSYHTSLDAEKLMAGRLKAHYGDIFSSQYIGNFLVYPKPYHFGFSYVGLMFLLMLFIPNIIWTKYQPRGYAEYAAKENKVLAVIEKIGQVAVTCLCVIFTDFNPHIYNNGYGVQFSMRILYLMIAVLLMIFYEIFWIRYFRSHKEMSDFYRGFVGFPLAGATLPVMAFFILGIYGQNLALTLAAVLLGVGHIGIHVQHAKAVAVNKQ